MVESPQPILVVINVDASTREAVQAFGQRWRLARKPIVCRTPADLQKLKPGPEVWGRLVFALVVGGAITPECFAVWFLKVAPREKTSLRTLDHHLPVGRRARGAQQARPSDQFAAAIYALQQQIARQPKRRR